MRFCQFNPQFSFTIVTDPHCEQRLPLISLDIYVPRDERFGHLKFSDFLAYALKSLGQVLLPEITSLCDKTINEFDTFEDVLNLYEGGIKLPNGPTISKIRDHIPWEMLKELVRNDGERLLKFPKPDVIKGALINLFFFPPGYLVIAKISFHVYIPLKYKVFMVWFQRTSLLGGQMKSLHGKCLLGSTQLSSVASK